MATEVHPDLDPANWELGVADVSGDDRGYARFLVNSAVRASDDPATARAAALIGAAPDLLAACRAAREFLEDGYPPEEISPAEKAVRDALDAALAKARSCFEATGKSGARGPGSRPGD